MKVAWFTDTHLEFLDDEAVAKFAESIRDGPAEVVFLTGDITTGDLIHRHFQLLGRCGKTIYFVFGNHDYYHSTILKTRSAGIGVARGGHVYLTSEPDPIPLTKNSFIVGNDGWADGRAGDFLRNRVDINDCYEVEVGLADQVLAALEARREEDRPTANGARKRAVGLFEMLKETERREFEGDYPALYLFLDHALHAQDRRHHSRVEKEARALRERFAARPRIRSEVGDFAGKSPEQVLELMQRLSDDGTENIVSKLERGFEERRHAYVLTHAPPFREAHLNPYGEPGDPAWAVQFVQLRLGERLVEVMKEKPDKMLTVLCGHTHTGAYVTPLPNLEVRVGDASYGEPKMAGLLEVED